MSQDANHFSKNRKRMASLARQSEENEQQKEKEEEEEEEDVKGQNTSNDDNDDNDDDNKAGDLVRYGTVPSKVRHKSHHKLVSTEDKKLWAFVHPGITPLTLLPVIRHVPSTTTTTATTTTRIGSEATDARLLLPQTCGAFAFEQFKRMMATTTKSSSTSLSPSPSPSVLL